MTEHRNPHGTPIRDRIRDEASAPDPVAYADNHHTQFRRIMIQQSSSTVAAVRALFGEAAAHHLERLFEYLAEHEAEALDGYQRALSDARATIESLRDAVDTRIRDLRDANRYLGDERDAHLATLRRLADRYKRAGKPVPDDIAAAIDERELPF